MIPAFSKLLHRGLLLTVERVHGGPINAHDQAFVPESTVTVVFTGPITGELQLCADGAASLALARRMLKRDEIDDALRRDAVREVASIVCGLVCAEFAPLHCFVLQPPRTLPIVAFADALPVAGARLHFDDGCVAALLYIHNPLANASS